MTDKPKDISDATPPDPELLHNTAFTKANLIPDSMEPPKDNSDATEPDPGLLGPQRAAPKSPAAVQAESIQVVHDEHAVASLGKHGDHFILPQYLFEELRDLKCKVHVHSATIEDQQKEISDQKTKIVDLTVCLRKAIDNTIGRLLSTDKDVETWRSVIDG